MVTVPPGEAAVKSTMTDLLGAIFCGSMVQCALDGGAGALRAHALLLQLVLVIQQCILHLLHLNKQRFVSRWHEGPLKMRTPLLGAMLIHRHYLEDLGERSQIL